VAEYICAVNKIKGKLLIGINYNLKGSSPRHCLQAYWFRVLKIRV